MAETDGKQDPEGGFFDLLAYTPGHRPVYDASPRATRIETRAGGAGVLISAKCTVLFFSRWASWPFPPAATWRRRESWLAPATTQELAFIASRPKRRPPASVQPP